MMMAIGIGEVYKQHYDTCPAIHLEGCSNQVTWCQLLMDLTCVQPVMSIVTNILSYSHYRWSTAFPTPLNWSFRPLKCQHAAMHMQGSGCPSGTYLEKILLLLGQASHYLCSALAAVGRSTFISPESLGAFVACRLIPLNKCPVVRPIGIGEVPRRIIAKGHHWQWYWGIRATAGLWSCYTCNT